MSAPPSSSSRSSRRCRGVGPNTHFKIPLLPQAAKRWLPGQALPLTTLYSILATAHLIGALPILYLGLQVQILSTNTIYKVPFGLQIAVIFLAFLSGSAKVVWAVAIGYILCLNLWPLNDFKEQLFRTESSQFYEGYLTSIVLAWMNARSCNNYPSV
jgi:hypothetical protein